MKHYFLRVNGTGNAWPVPLGKTHPFYDPEDPEQLANVSYSLGCTEGDQVRWEILIDAGHGIVQYLIRHGNRIPEAVVLTHAHLDHTLSLDWIIQSFFRQHQKERRYPLFSSMQAWDFVSRSFPQLTSMTRHHALHPGRKCDFDGIPELRLTMLPVFHGPHAPGPSMLLFELNTGKQVRKLVFTGDLVCPLLRKSDHHLLEGADMVFADANNRFPYIASNHWSISPVSPADTKMEGFPGHDGQIDLAEVSNLNPELRKFRDEFSCSYLIANHLPADRHDTVHGYFDDFLGTRPLEIPLSVFEFTRQIRPKQVLLVHYSGTEDLNHHEQAILNPVQLENWAGAEAERFGLSAGFVVPRAGDRFEL